MIVELIRIGVLGGPAIRLDNLIANGVFDAADDQRRSRLVDQDAVRLVDQAEVHATHDGLIAAAGKSTATVAQHFGLQAVLGTQ